MIGSEGQRNKIIAKIESCNSDKEIKRLISSFIMTEFENPTYPDIVLKNFAGYMGALRNLVDFFSNLTIDDLSLSIYKSFKQKISDTHNRDLKNYLNKLLPVAIRHFLQNTAMTTLKNIQELLAYQNLCQSYVENYSIGTAYFRESTADMLFTSSGDTEVKRLLDEFIRKEFEVPSCLYEDAKRGINDFFTGIRYLISIVGKLSIRDISWQTFCYYQQRINNITEPFNFHSEIRGKLNSFLPDVFKYIVNNTTETCLENIKDLKTYEHHLYVKEKLNSDRRSFEYPPFMVQEIYSNFPLRSIASSLYLFEYTYMATYDRIKAQVLVNLHSNNIFIKNILGSFIETFDRDTKTAKPNRMENRVFFYFFESSLYTIESLPEKVENFTFETFKKQYRFYTKIDEKYPVSNKKTVDVLKEFYIFLVSHIRTHGINHNIFQGTAININVLCAPNFNATYRQGYKYVLFAPHEKAPTFNRLCIVDNGIPNARATKINSIRTDFNEIIYMQFIDDVKNYVWDTSKYLEGLSDAFYYIKEFLNLKYEYDLQHENVIPLHTAESEIFSEDFMFTYMSTILNKYESAKTIANIFLPVKYFLKFYKSKYNYDETLNSYLQYTQPILRDSDGGMAIEDFNLIADKFRKAKDKSVIDELLFIILYLKSKTPLRIGEILNLRRDCIESIDDKNNSGTIVHYTKIQDERIQTEVTLECIEFINKAKHLTSNFSRHAINREFKDHIFIKPTSYYENQPTYKIVTLSNTFYSTFNDALNELDLKGKYTVYDIRHMRKNTILKGATKAGIDVLDVFHMLGGTPETNYRSYINSNDTELYVELFTGTIVSNVNIFGNIVIDEAVVSELNTVNGNLGSCKQEKCIKNRPSDINLLDKYPFYKCLMCENFITTAFKADVFEYYINEIKAIQKKSNNDEEINDCETLLKLLGAYFEKQLLMLQSQGGINNVSN